MKRVFFASLLLLLVISFSSAIFADSYPKFDISGYKKWRLYKTQVDPPSNFFLAQSQLGGLSYSLSSGPWQERLSLRINSEITKGLIVNYDIEQEPDTPQKTNVDVQFTKDNFKIFFGEFTATFNENEFANTTKSLNGAMVSYDDKTTKVQLVPSVKLKSETQGITTAFGNNTRGPYSIGRGSIMEGSEQVFLNDKLMTRGKDYTIDYFEGKITFTAILSSLDKFSYSYEYTNLIDLFFPTVSKREFFGISGSTKMNKLFFEEEKAINVQTYSTSETEIFNAPGINQTLSSEGNTTNESTSFFVYYLKNKPIVKFSESLTLKNQPLKLNEDYSIDYTKGTVKIVSEIIPDPEKTLKINYSYYLTSLKTESIIGNDSRGPYQLNNKFVVNDSESIFVNGKQNYKGLDYSIDYTEGKITFNEGISQASSITANYNCINTSSIEADSSKNQFAFGATYLKESSKKGGGAATATVTESRLGNEIKTPDFLLNTKNFPIDSSQPITVQLTATGSTTPEVLVQGIDFYIPTTEAQVNAINLPYINSESDTTNGYATGSIKFIRSILNTDNVTVTYSYNKKILGSYSGSGNGSTGPYILSSVNGMIPTQFTMLVIRNDGSSITETYIPNSSKTLKDGQYSINYSYPYTPTITFNSPLPSGKKFELTYYCVPASGTITDQDLNHDVTGINASATIGDNFLIDSAIGISRTDQTTISEPGVDVLQGNNTRGPYSLTNNKGLKLIQNSEQVFLDGNKLNKDMDYLIDYDNGRVTFYYQIPTSRNTIEVRYNYQSSSGLSTGKEMRNGYAYRLTSSAKYKDFDFGGTYREIDQNFSPMGTTQIGAGSQQKEFHLTYTPNSKFNMSTSMLETKSQKGSQVGIFNWNTDRKISLSYLPDNFGQLSMSLRNYKGFDDVASSTEAHSNDSISNAFSATIIPNQIQTDNYTFSNKNDFSKSESFNNLNNTSTNITYLHTANTLTLLKRANFGIDYQQSEPVSANSTETTSHSISKDLSYNFDWDLTFNPIKRFGTRARVVKHEQTDLLTNAFTATKNESAGVNFDPLNNLSGTYDKNRSETLSVKAGASNPYSESDNYNVRFSPFSSISCSYGQTNDKSYQETGARSKGDLKRVSFDFIPLSFLKLSTGWNSQLRDSSAINGSNEITTILNTDSRNYRASITPLGLFTLNGEYAIEDYSNRNNDTIPVDTKTQNISTTYSTSLTPIPILSSSISYSEKRTKDQKTLTETPKIVISANNSLRVFDWGTVSHNWSQERNQGEVLAGVVTGLDILKISNDYSFSTTIPQASIVLSSIVFSLNYKDVMYVDYLDPTKNFKANLLSFEGTLNF